MSASVELVLAVEPTAAREWMAAPVASNDHGGAARPPKTRANRRASAARQPASRVGAPAPASMRADLGAAIAEALNRTPGMTQVRGVEPSTIRMFVDPRRAWRAALAVDGSGARRLTAVRTEEAIPGVWRSETLCDEAVEAGASDVLPATIKEKVGKLDKPAPSAVLSAHRGVWRWTGADGTSVDIELHDVRDAISDASPGGMAMPLEKPGRAEPASSHEVAPAPIAFCELRLIAHLAETPASADIASANTNTPVTTAGDAAEHIPAERSAAAAAPKEHDRASDSTSIALQALFAAAGALADTLPVFPVLIDGYARACSPAQSVAPVRATRIDLSRARHPHDALIAAASSIGRQWFGNEAGVRAGVDAEFVHQMRVALRRLKTLLKTFPRWRDDTWERTLAADLDWLGGLLGQARDLDVFVDTTLPALAAADVENATWASLQARAGERRDAARARVRAALHTRRYAALSLAWLRWLATQRCSSGPLAFSGKPLARYAAKRVRKHYGRLLAKPGLTSLTPPERHRRRIEAKRLRYTLEFFESLASRKTRREISKRLSRIQSVLGDGNDAAAALRFLEAIDVPPYEHGFARGWCEAVNRWSAVEGERLLKGLGKPRIVRAP